MTIELSDELLERAGLSAGEVTLALAILLFQEELLTLGQAAEMANLHQAQFQKELATRKISIHYGVEELERDLRTLSNLDDE